MIDLLIRALKRYPYFPITIDGECYMNRHWTFQLGGAPRDKDNKREGSWLKARVHEITRSDRDRSLHDHPFDYLTFILKGGYWEITERPMRSRSKLIQAWPALYSTWYGPGSVLFRFAENAHRLVVPGREPAVTWFVSGPKRREWGFHTPAGWVHWTDFGGD